MTVRKNIRAAGAVVGAIALAGTVLGAGSASADTGVDARKSKCVTVSFTPSNDLLHNKCGKGVKVRVKHQYGNDWGPCVKLKKGATKSSGVANAKRPAYYC